MATSWQPCSFLVSQFADHQEFIWPAVAFCMSSITGILSSRSLNLVHRDSQSQPLTVPTAPWHKFHYLCRLSLVICSVLSHFLCVRMENIGVNCCHESWLSSVVGSVLVWPSQMENIVVNPSHESEFLTSDGRCSPFLSCQNNEHRCEVKSYIWTRWWAVFSFITPNGQDCNDLLSLVWTVISRQHSCFHSIQMENIVVNSSHEFEF